MSQAGRIGAAVLGAVLGLGVLAAPLRPQDKFDNLRRGQARDMLRGVAENVRNHYYDPTFHGLDIEARFKAADDKIQKATALGQAFTAIAGALEGLNDSHTFFLPPARPFKVEYGYEHAMVGDACFVVAVRPETDAATKLKPGDQILAIEGFAPTRDTLGKMKYYFNALFPRQSMHLDVRSPGGETRKVEVLAKTRQLKRVLDLSGDSGDQDFWQLVREGENEEHLLRERYVEYADKLMIWKMPEFDMTDSNVDSMFGKARKFKALVLDLRGNPGGAVVTLERMVGNVVDHDVTIAKRVGRKELKPQLAKTRGSSVFTGKLIVLLDSRSASASELFARTIQLEKRGTVLGDRSSGSVMEAQEFSMRVGTDTVAPYGASVTDADLIMADGKSLEHNGVIPDELILPTAADLAANRDPVLARAAELAGVALEPAAAGKMFPIEWKSLN
jgi:C-terminal processing protease CtpA/Prc